MNEFYLKEHNKIIQINSISQSEDLVTTITKDSIAKTYYLSKLKRIELGDDAIEGMYIVEYPVPMTAAVEPSKIVPLRKKILANGSNFALKHLLNQLMKHLGIYVNQS